MLQRATDVSLRRDARASLAHSIVVEALNTYFENRESVLQRADVQQMIRALDEEVRAQVAHIPRDFINVLSSKSEGQLAPPSKELLFDSVVRPFIREVWPQERSLASPGSSEAFAKLPAMCGDRFAEATDLVLRFIVPFDCWSMFDFGLYSEDDEGPHLAQIDTLEKAEALLKLLSHSIGTLDNAVVPHELADALEEVRAAAPQLSSSQHFRRLETLTRQ